MIEAKTLSLLNGVVAAATAALVDQVTGSPWTATALWGIGSGLVVGGISYGLTSATARSAHHRLNEERADRMRADEDLGQRLTAIGELVERSSQTMVGIRELLARIDEREKMRERLEDRQREDER